LVSDSANLVSQSATFMLNETISVLQKLNPEKLDSLKQYEGKTLEIDIENQDLLIQAVFTADGPLFFGNKQDNPNTIIRTTWKGISKDLLAKSDTAKHLEIEGDVFFAEQMISSVKSLLPELEDIASKLMSESSAISLSERINFLAQILLSIQETAFLGVQQSLAKGFTSNKDFGEATDRIAKIRNKVDLLQARIKELEL
tara:strand:- start:384 stop:983 length:600 start_codon:yes stop_codon:yes gene_type:complete